MEHHGHVVGMGLYVNYSHTFQIGQNKLAVILNWGKDIAIEFTFYGDDFLMNWADYYQVGGEWTLDMTGDTIQTILMNGHWEV